MNETAARLRDWREPAERLRREEAALMPSGDFLPVFEEHGLMPELDHWVAQELVSAGVSAARLMSEIAEADSLARLKMLGVAYAQGFGICQPHPIERVALGAA